MARNRNTAHSLKLRVRVRIFATLCTLMSAASSIHVLLGRIVIVFLYFVRFEIGRYAFPSKMANRGGMSSVGTMVTSFQD